MITPTAPRRVKGWQLVGPCYALAMSTAWGSPVADSALAPLPEPPARLRRLLQKYDLLIRLSDSEPGRTLQRRDDMRAIAQRFPAALREWEQQPAHELARRRQLVAAALAAFASGAERAADSASSPARAPAAEREAAEGWLRYGLDVHDCLRAVLKLRSYLSQQAGGRLPRGSARPDRPPAAGFAASVPACQALVADCEVPWLLVTSELLAAIADPARGRLTAIAYQAVAARHGVGETAIKQALFGADPAPAAGDSDAPPNPPNPPNPAD